jgi:diguanylate cyclase (GGDEF)-like protein
MGSRPLSVLLVAVDRALLRRLSKFLALSGYDVRQAADWQSSAAAIEAHWPDLLILDGDGTSQHMADLCDALAARSADEPIYSLVLAEHPSSDAVRRALAAGIDDFLAKPVVYGELLARLRTGARALELERRLARLRGVDHVAQLPNRGACEAHLRRAPNASCVLLDLDFFGRVNRLHGHPCGDEILRSVATRLHTAAAPDGVAYSLQGGRFAVVLSTPETAAAVWAERFRTELEQVEVPCSPAPVRLTASFGVAGADDSAGADQCLRHAEEAMLLAKGLGRNCVVQYRQLADDGAMWAELAVPGKLFERTVASDIMTPCPTTFTATETLAEALTTLRHTQLDALPVVDDQGQLVGVVTAAMAGGTGASTMRIGEAMLIHVATCRESDSLDTLRDFFSRDTQTHMVVVNGRRPTGIVTADNLVALGVKLTENSFAVSDAAAGASALLVPDLRPTAAV